MVSFWPRAAPNTLSQTAKYHTFPFADAVSESSNIFVISGKYFKEFQ
jgi:hypothetical protein